MHFLSIAAALVFSATAFAQSTVPSTSVAPGLVLTSKPAKQAATALPTSALPLLVLKGNISLDKGLEGTISSLAPMTGHTSLTKADVKTTDGEVAVLLPTELASSVKKGAKLTAKVVAEGLLLSVGGKPLLVNTWAKRQLPVAASAPAATPYRVPSLLAAPALRPATK